MDHIQLNLMVGRSEHIGKSHDYNDYCSHEVRRPNELPGLHRLCLMYISLLIVNLIYKEAKESLHFLDACILLSFHGLDVKFCMICFYSR